MIETDDDGLRFDPESIQATPITHEAEYKGVRLLINGMIGHVPTRFRSMSVSAM